MRHLGTALTIFCAAAAILTAPTAAAAPECTNTAPNTTLCSTNGSSQIVTSPSVTNNGPFFPYGGLGLRLGGVFLVF